MPDITIFESPEKLKAGFTFFRQGSSPTILDGVINFLEAHKEEIEELNLAWYLFNNEILHENLTRLSSVISSINIVTIPLEGYDDTSPKDISDLNTRQIVDKNKTKRDLAVKIFKSHYKKEVPKNYNLYFFPHIYIRSAFVNPFSRGQMPYSLHLKSGLIKFKNGSFAVIISSSNLAVRDLVKEENLSIISITTEQGNRMAQFYKDLIQESIHVTKFTSELNTSKNKFEWKPNINGVDLSLIAPFYKGSGFEVESILIEKVKAAKKRVWLVGQHLASINYQVPIEYLSESNQIEKERTSLLKAIADLVGINIRFISQTFVKCNKDTRNFGTEIRTPANTKAFEDFSQYLYDKKNIEFVVNKNVHAKFIIIDDELIITTFNFTPTPFIFLDNVKIDKFIKMPNQPPYQGVYSEVGMFVSTRALESVGAYEEYFNSIATRKDSIKVYPIVPTSS